MEWMYSCKLRLTICKELTSDFIDLNERELNRIKFALKRESDRLNLESQQKYKSELEKASLQYKRIFTQYKEWQIKESDRISKLKIIIPDALQTTYEKLSLLEE